MSSSDIVVRLLITARDQASGVLGALTGRVAQLAAAMAAWFSVSAMVDFFRGAVSGAADLQQQLTVLNQVAGTTAEELAQLKAAAEAAANSPLPYTASQAAGGLIELAKAGQTTKQLLASLPPVLAMASAGQMEVAQSAGIMTTALAAFKLPAEDAARVANTLVAGANASQTSVQGLSEALSYAGPMAYAAGYSLERVVAMIGKLADGGVDASRAGTALNSILSQLQDPASAASAALGNMGITTRDLGKVLGLLATGSPMAERAIVAFGQEAGPALRTLIASGTKGVDDLRLKLEGATTAAEDAAAAMQTNLKGALGDLGSTWDVIKQKFGEGFLPVLEREVRSLSAQLRAWIDSGQLEQIRAGLVAAFEAATAAVKVFIAEFDLKALTGRLASWGQDSKTVFNDWTANIGRVRDVTQRILAEIDLLWSGAMTVILKVDQTYNGLAANVMYAYSKLLELRVKVGTATREEAAAARKTAEEYKRAYADAGKAVDQGIADTKAAWARLFAEQKTGAAAAGAAADDGSKKVVQGALNQALALGLTADQLDALGAGLTGFDAKTQAFSASAAAAAAATKDLAAAARAGTGVAEVQTTALGQQGRQVTELAAMKQHLASVELQLHAEQAAGTANVEATAAAYRNAQAAVAALEARSASATATGQAHTAAIQGQGQALEMSVGAVRTWDAATKQWVMATDEAAAAQAKLTDAQRAKTSEGAVALAASQAEMAAVEQGTQKTQAGTAATNQSTVALKAQNAAKAEAKAKAAEQLEALNQTIQKQTAEMDILAKTTALITAQGQARVTHLQNLQAEALTRGQASEAERLGLAVTRESIASAKLVAEATQQEADAARAFADALAEKARMEQETAPAALKAVREAELSAQAMQLQADTAKEVVRNEQAMAVAAEEAARATQVLNAAFAAAGVQGVKSMSDVRSAIGAVTSGGDLEALGSALKAAFDRGALAAADYQAALDEIKKKQDVLRGQVKPVTFQTDWEAVFKTYGTDLGRYQVSMQRTYRASGNPDYVPQMVAAYKEWLRLQAGGAPTPTGAAKEALAAPGADSMYGESVAVPAAPKAAEPAAAPVPPAPTAPAATPRPTLEVKFVLPNGQSTVGTFPPSAESLLKTLQTQAGAT
ncbi:phage tail tape measure protein [uncultured Thiodictyon sp.]|uniref:phage tail tape measure protein n=1 Tax=uncultured Thiodictyon sp. TaxID=1846217 RepID=UPI0025DB21D5|nr:phage tail tape measure protein [uncultured Thiodictyon sp.]